MSACRSAQSAVGCAGAAGAASSAARVRLMNAGIGGSRKGASGSRNDVCRRQRLRERLADGAARHRSPIILTTLWPQTLSRVSRETRPKTTLGARNLLSDIGGGLAQRNAGSGQGKNAAARGQVVRRASPTARACLDSRLQSSACQVPVKLLRSTAIVSAMTLLSRVLGFLRDSGVRAEIRRQPRHRRFLRRVSHSQLHAPAVRRGLVLAGFRAGAGRVQEARRPEGAARFHRPRLPARWRRSC
jgi:hypothetical protein